VTLLPPGDNPIAVNNNNNNNNNNSAADVPGVAIHLYQTVTHALQ
jgi:hypothetical protein